MDVEIHLLIGSIVMLVLAIFLAMGRHEGKLPISTLRGSNSKNLKRKATKGEKRAHPRYKTSLRVKYTHLSEEGISWVKDISSGGMRLFLDDSFQVGSLLRMEISLPYDPKPVFARGSIVWTEKRENDAGLNFDEVEQEGIDRIVQYIGHKERIKID